MNLKQEILAARSDVVASKLADQLLKEHPIDDSDVVLEQAQKQLLLTLLLAASSHADNCLQFFWDRLRQDPIDWRHEFQDPAKSLLVSQLEMLSENLRKEVGSMLYQRLKSAQEA